jgi:hypothetical protein
LIKPLPYSLHNPIEMSREQLQTAWVEQQPSLATGLRASSTSCLRMSELLMLPERCDILFIEPESINGSGGGKRSCLLGLLRGRRAMLRRRHGLFAAAARAMLRSLCDLQVLHGRVFIIGEQHWKGG